MMQGCAEGFWKLCMLRSRDLALIRGFQCYSCMAVPNVQGLGTQGAKNSGTASGTVFDLRFCRSGLARGTEHLMRAWWERVRLNDSCFSIGGRTAARSPQ